jgi:azobenzene reductase
MNNKILILNFSLREVSNSSKVAKYLNEICGPTSKVCNYKDLNIPRWDEEYWNPTSKWEAFLTEFRSLMNEADGYIYILPEYNGAASPLFNEFNLFINKQSNFKPVMLIGVSDSRGGTYPISQVRGYGSKNSKVNIIPEHIIIRNCSEMLNPQTKPEWNLDNNYLIDRIKYTLNVLDLYTTAAIRIRQSIVVEPKFGNGM